MKFKDYKLKNNEVFKPVVGYEENYKISNYGTLLSLSTNRIMKVSKIQSGYYSVKIQKNNKQFRTGIHRLVAMAFIPTNDYTQEVNHKDGNKENNHISNLEWVSSKQNINHSLLNGLKATKVDPKVVEDLCKFLTTNESRKYSYEDLSKKFNLEISEIESVYNRRRWKSISNKYPNFQRISFITNKKTDDEIHSICKFIKQNPELSNQKVADVFGCNRTYIADLKKMKNRKNITTQYFK